MIGEVAIAEKVNFVCKNINNREQDLAVIIDFKGATLTKNGTKYIINSMNETKIFASRNYKYDNITGEIVLTFDRVIEKLLYRDFRDGQKFDFADFACKKLY
jgi:hypothetical protein